MRKVFLLSFFLISISCAGQNGIIKGRLIDYESGKPIKDGIIILFGTTNGTMTDNKGYFQIRNLPLERSELIFSNDSGTYRHLILGNILLTKIHNSIDLQDVPLLRASSSLDNMVGKCIYLEGYSYKIDEIDGAFRYIPNHVAFINLDKPEKCN